MNEHLIPDGETLADLRPRCVRVADQAVQRHGFTIVLPGQEHGPDENETAAEYRERMLKVQTAHLLDCDGELLAKLPVMMLYALAAKFPSNDSGAEIAEILAPMALAMLSVQERAARNGRNVGRLEVHEQVHQLLRIDRIVEAIEQAGRDAGRLP